MCLNYRSLYIIYFSFCLLSLQIYSEGIIYDSNYTLDIEYQEIEEADDCVYNLCAQGSTCVDLYFDYTCVCPENSQGHYCEGKQWERDNSLNLTRGLMHNQPKNNSKQENS